MREAPTVTPARSDAASLAVPRKLFATLLASAAQKRPQPDPATPAPDTSVRDAVISDVTAAAAEAGMTSEEVMAALAPAAAERDRFPRSAARASAKKAKRELRDAVRDEVRHAMGVEGGVLHASGFGPVAMNPYVDAAYRRAALRAEIEEATREERMLAMEARLGAVRAQAASTPSAPVVAAPPSAARDAAEVDIMRAVSARMAQREDDLQRHLEDELAQARAQLESANETCKQASETCTKKTAEIQALRREAELEVAALTRAHEEELEAVREAAAKDATRAAAESRALREAADAAAVEAAGAADLRTELVALTASSEKEVLELKQRAEKAEARVQDLADRLAGTERALKEAAAWSMRKTEVERLTKMNAKLAQVNRELVAEKETAKSYASAQSESVRTMGEAVTTANARAHALAAELKSAKSQLDAALECSAGLEAQVEALSRRVASEESEAQAAAQVGAAHDAAAAAEAARAEEALACAKERARAEALELRLDAAVKFEADAQSLGAEVAALKELVTAFEDERKDLGGRIKALTAQLAGAEKLREENARLSTLNSVLRAGMPDGAKAAMDYDQSVLATVDADVTALREGRLPVLALPGLHRAAPAAPAAVTTAPTGLATAGKHAGGAVASARSREGVRALAARVALPIDLLRAHRSETMMRMVREVSAGASVRFSDILGVQGCGAPGGMRRLLCTEANLLVLARPGETCAAGYEGALLPPLALQDIRSVRWNAEDTGDVELRFAPAAGVEVRSLVLQTPRQDEVIGALAALLSDLPLDLDLEARGDARAIVSMPFAE